MNDFENQSLWSKMNSKWSLWAQKNTSETHQTPITLNNLAMVEGNEYVLGFWQEGRELALQKKKKKNHF